jgi:hypothetical protein
VGQLRAVDSQGSRLSHGQYADVLGILASAILEVLDGELLQGHGLVPGKRALG